MMNRYAAGLAKLRITVTSDDGSIKAAVETGRYPKITVGFRPGAYPRYDGETLSRLLSGLYTRAWSAYREGRARVFAKIHGAGRERSVDDERRRLADRMATLAVTARSDRHDIAMATRGLAEWRVRVGDGVPDELDEQGFTGELSSVYRSVTDLHRVRATRLRIAHTDHVIARAVEGNELGPTSVLRLGAGHGR